MEKQIIIASRYRVIRKIGEGGMAKVYLAYDTINEKNVALKILKKENVNDKKIRHFKKEAMALSLMDDENIVKIFEVGEEGTIHYISTEFIEGMTLKEYITTCFPLTVDEVINISKQILKGLVHAHEKNVVHKDIKSQNILLDQDRNVKITDFGIADVLDDDATRTQSLMGTPQYIAPEILNREKLTEQSDLYSVGILMYEMLLGKAPFTGEKPAVIMIKQINHPIPSIIMERFDVPQSLENVVIKATAKKLVNRYQSASEMITDLDKVNDDNQKNAEKLVLLNDIISEEALEKTISINNNLDYNKLKAESASISKNKKRIKIVSISVISILLILIATLFFIKQPAIIMPNVVGETEEKAKEDIVLIGIPIDNISILVEDSESVKEGLIISTNPVENTEISLDQKIVLKVSSGPSAKVLKDYSNLLAEASKVELEEQGYVVELIYEDSKIAKGSIISQTPPAGTMLNQGEKIVFKVSTGTYEIEVPNFTGLTKEEADKWASENGINTTSTYKCNDTYNKGLISSQNPTYGTKIKNGGSISLQISDGKCSAITPPTDAPQDGNWYAN
ncbi:MAG: Stk1 family PASTA domain-containing Ser/Thr kinase [Mycoplasmatales bacterium]